MSALCSTNGRLVTSFFLSTNSNSCCYLWKRLAKFIKVWSKFPWTRLRCFWVPFLEPWLYYDGYFMGQMLRSGKTESFVMSSEFTKRKSLASQFFIWTLECIFPASISHFDGQNLPKTSENPLHNLQAQYRLICGVLLSRFSRGRLGRARDGRNASTVRFFLIYITSIIRPHCDVPADGSTTGTHPKKIVAPKVSGGKQLPIEDAAVGLSTLRPGELC